MVKLKIAAIACITAITISLIVSISLLSGLAAEGEVGLDAALLTISVTGIISIVKKEDKP